jgi:hypothetical protein
MTPLHISTNFRSDIVVICGPIVSRLPEISGSAYSMVASSPSLVMRT